MVKRNQFYEELIEKVLYVDGKSRINTLCKYCGYKAGDTGMVGFI